MPTKHKIKDTVPNLPQKPGVYIFLDQKGKILYIGKAKDIKKRVSSYFLRKKDLFFNKQKMVSKIDLIDYIVADSEIEALLLESNLIKKHQPPYNVILKDDKQYQYIKIDYFDDFPKIYTVRKVEKGKALYYGPFTDSYAVRKTLNLLNKLFPYRECNQNIFLDNKEELKQKVCLRYHIKRCLGPCVGKISKDEYNLLIRQCELFLQGKQEKILKEIKKEMRKAAQKKDFEKAAFLRDQLSDLEKIIDRQKIISPKKIDQDIISYYQTKEIIIINLFIIREGKLTGKENFILKTLGQEDTEILPAFIKQYYFNQTAVPKEIIIQSEIKDKKLISTWLSKKNNQKVKIVIPQKGKNKELINLGIKNAKIYFSANKLRLNNQSSRNKPKVKEILKELTKIFKLERVPNRIECYDISNIQGTFACGSMVVCEDGLPQKKEYRRFKIKSIKQPDDTGMIKEMLSRRFKHYNKENIDKKERWPLPDLIIIDGGRGQLNAAFEVLKKYKLDIPTLSLAKKFEEIYAKNLIKPIKLEGGSPALLFLQKIRDEAHRFAITYHRKLREKEITSSVTKI